VGTASRSPLSTFESNVRGTWNLLEACRMCPRLIERIVVASSDKAYGAHEHLPYTEDTPLQGRFPYDASKSCADLISLSYHATYGLPLAITRCGNLYGGGDINFNRLIPGTIRSVLRGERPIVRSDGTFVRDYFYVRDAVAAYLELAERLPHEQFTGQAFNFGTETPVSVVDLVGLILALMGRSDLEPVILNEANHEIPRQYLDCTKARQLMQWEPAFTLDAGLRETIAWYRERLGVADRTGPVATLVHAG
jgi:CDP-glucose 4,6-dehydratase